MEWRIFLPQLGSQDEWIPSSLSNSFNSTMESVLQHFDMKFGESRTDVYVVGSDNYGLKARVSLICFERILWIH